MESFKLKEGRRNINENIRIQRENKEIGNECIGKG